MISSSQTIPSADQVYYRVLNDDIRKRHRIKVLKENYIPPKIFKNEEDSNGMSVDWEKHCKPQDTQNNHGSLRPAKEFGVVGLLVGKIREFPQKRLDVIYYPLRNNKAHSLIENFPSNIQRDENLLEKEMQTNIRNYFANPEIMVTRWILFPEFNQSE